MGVSIPGIVEIDANEVGIVRKKFGPKLSPGQYIALMGEAGYQADVLPPGTHFGYLSVKYEIHKVPVVSIAPGEIGVVIAKDGIAIPQRRSLGRVVQCNNFQDARAFLENGGEKGRQLGFLPTGNYQINTELFTIVTSENAIQHGMDPCSLRVCVVEPDKIGIVRTFNGLPIHTDEIAGPKVPGHDNFQNGQQFIEAGGYNGLQEETLPTGEWNINPWFAEVEQVPVVKIEPGRVGVVVSHTGKTSATASDEPVNDGCKGVQKNYLLPGKHRINTRTKDVIIVPTHDITLDWSNKSKSPSNYDSSLRCLKLRSQDGFGFDIEVTQVVRIDGADAPKMISRIGSPATRIGDPADIIEPSLIKLSSIRNLVVRVLEPMVGNYFRNSAQYYKAIDFQSKRTEIQKNAADHIKVELNKYGVQAVGTFINEIDLPDTLEAILTEQEETYVRIQGQKIALIEQQNRQQLEYHRALANSQAQIVQSQIEANSIRQMGAAKADILKLEVEAVGGFRNFLEQKKVENWSKIQLPSVLVNSSGDRANSLDAVITPMLMGATTTATHSTSHSQPQLPNSSSSPPRLGASLTRCPIVILIDTSLSISDDYLERLERGLNIFEQELGEDNITRRCTEVSIITFGGSVNILQSFSNPGSFFVQKLESQGSAIVGHGLEIALKNIEHRKSIYKNQNVQHYQPWLILILGSSSTDDWQGPAQEIRQAVSANELNFLCIGTQEANIDILEQISPPSLPPSILEELKFEPLFYGLADLMKRISNHQRKNRLLEQLANAAKQAADNLPPDQAAELSQCVAELMTEASQIRPTKEGYSTSAAGLYKTASKLGETTFAISELIPHITKSLGLS
ncbi:VWA domain-containing protein [Acaryochloris sp. 'Moss Beach']|uniref:SPFH domain-containing protein n=1 Tax=Acaryochloris sp. 'Moss Beach' TaxID=2740837 RepID=UPI001EFF3691|nr:SPFH domain-containing protein [Acaryochloris sp. 'Moss Beach']UJB68976.1 VWA domain-containing protein [Acaryochloris sp. 'Moss Beach']